MYGDLLKVARKVKELTLSAASYYHRHQEEAANTTCALGSKTWITRVTPQNLCADSSWRYWTREHVRTDFSNIVCTHNDDGRLRSKYMMMVITNSPVSYKSVCLSSCWLFCLLDANPHHVDVKCRRQAKILQHFQKFSKFKFSSPYLDLA